MVVNYFENIKDEDRDENERKILKLIQEDVKRTLPDTDLFRS